MKPPPTPPPARPETATGAGKPAAETPQASTNLTQDQLRQIRSINIANIVKRLKEGRTITKQERVALEESAAAPPPARSAGEPSPILSMVGVLPDPVEIAKHQRPGRTQKSTAKEIREREDIVAQLIGVKTRMQIHDFCRVAWGVCWRTADTYAAHARAMLLEACDTSKTEMRARNFRLYCAFLSDPTVSHSDKLRALHGIRDQFGLDAQQQIRAELTGPGGKDLPAGPQVFLYLPDNGRYDPNPGTAKVPDPDAATESTVAPPVNGK